MQALQTITVSINGVISSDIQAEADIHGAPGSRVAYLNRWVLCKFPTGTKLHATNAIADEQADGTFRVPGRQVVCNRACRAVGWETERQEANSGWTGEKK